MKLCGVSAAPVGGGFSEAPQRFGRGPWRRRHGPRPHGPRIALCCYVSHARARSQSDPSFPLTPRPEGTSPRRRRCGRGGLRCCDARAWAASCLRTRGWRHGAGETRPGLGWLGVLESARFIPTPPPPPPPSAWQGPGWCDMQTSPWRSATDQAATSAGASWVPLARGRADGGMGAAPACTLCWAHCRCEVATGDDGAPSWLSSRPPHSAGPGRSTPPPSRSVAGAAGIRVQVTCGFTQHPQWLPPPPSGRRGNAVPQ